MKLQKAGYNLGVIAMSLILLWIGIVKFTTEEALGIKPLVEHSFLMSWLYKIASVNAVSMIIGVFEIVTAIFLLISFKSNIAGRIGGYLSLIIFITTLSFLMTTPGIWKTMESVPVTDFFILKDLGFLAIALQVIGHHSDRNVTNTNFN